MNRPSVLALAFVLSGCTVGPNYERPETMVDESWLTPVSDAEIDAKWWTALGDPLLDDLVASAIAGNKDLAEAGARLREARANRDAASGRASPQIGALATSTENRLSENGLLPVGKVPDLGPELSLYDVGFDASWELDLWGGTRRAIESAEARAQAADEAWRRVLIQIVAEVVRTYIDLRASQALALAATAEADAQGAIAALVAERVRVGVASRVDLQRAEAQARSAAAAVPAIESDAVSAAYRLALLLGRPPEDLMDILARPVALPAPPAAVSAGLRSDILRRRPDVRQAERELAAYTADIGVATAELFPRLSLLGGIGFQAREPTDLLSASSLRFLAGPSLRWPIFSGGRIRAQIRAANARSEAALIRYERAVLTALSDSETALNRQSAAARTRVEREEARAVAAEAVALARARYRSGEDDLIALLATQAAFSASDRQTIQASGAELIQVAALYKALGGGWEGVCQSKCTDW
jgi:NodT family efflux transporter outer membrane factor (OMF) lipoprotein